MISFLPKLKIEKLFEADMIPSLDSILQALFFFGEKMNLTPVAHKKRPRLRDSVILHAEHVWISYIVSQLLNFASL